VVSEFLRSKSRKDGGLFHEELKARLKGTKH
jgi:hypothetical protein